METILLVFVIAIVMALLYIFCRLIFSLWGFPILAYRKLKKNGLDGPSPRFPFGNLSEMKKKTINFQSSNISHDIHSTLFPFLLAGKTLSERRSFIGWGLSHFCT
ncbi:hypothetical protein ACFXTN_001977 [Malus domestica]